ncbi:MAG: LytTR family transcriptional regulator [Saprospiraceae bacterium]|nr:LytTR family transcriptional regulator [Saprospiraceae bacterium]
MTNTSKYYPDITFFLIAIPLISAFNYYLTYANIRLNGFLILTYSIDTIQGYIAWYCVRLMIIRLDQSFPFSKHMLSRLILQIVSTTLTGLFIIIASTEMVSWIFRGKPASVDFYQTDVFIISIWFLVINSYYIIAHFYREWTKSMEYQKELIDAKLDFLLVPLGQKEIKIPYRELDLICIRNGVTEIYSKGKILKCFLTLDSLEKQLPEFYFFRANRQFILSKQAIGEYKKIVNGKIQVFLTVTDPDLGDIIISRTRAPRFKQWLVVG